MGVIESKEIAINFRVLELRAFFESLQAVNSQELGILLQESKDLQESYQMFIETQGTMVN
jgi:hypothetical protein